MIERSHIRRSPRVVSALLLTAVFATASCDQKTTTPTTINFAPASAVLVSSVPATLFAQPRNSFSCPFVTPFFAPMVVVVQPDGTPGFVVTQIALNFTDRSGQTQPQITLPAPVPTTQFGSALDQSRGLSFPVTLGLGCGVGRTGTLVVVVDTRDGMGHKGTGQMRLSVN
jgi:hypothetical protein